MWGRLEVVFLVSVLVTVTRVEGYYFEENFSHVYKYQAVSDMLGMHNVTTVVQFQVQPVNTSLSVTPLNVLHINSFVQFTEQGYCLVDLIHVHREDEDEVVMIKKVLASTFSANVQVDFEGNTVSYKSQEMDHTGVLTHDYHVERTAAGMVVRRRHSSNDNVIRHHEKDLHYHPDGTLHHFSAIDTVTLSGPPNTITSRNQQQPDDIMSHDFLQDRLLDEDLREVGQEALQRRCSEGQNQCQDEKHLFLDIIARIGSATSQQLISRYVLAHPNATQQEVERTLVHCIAIAHPELVTLQSVEKLCFGHNDSLHGVQELEQTQRKACLAIGSLVKSSKEGKHSEYSEKLVEKLENWLKIHNESESGPILQRSKRDVLDTDEPQEHHIVSKMVLLHSIGNAGLPRSLSHLTSYMEPNVGTSQWRRAAIYGLRHYTCQHSSKALLLSSIHDDNDNIREEAYKMFQKHPQKGNLTTEHYNIVLSQSYTYPTLMRMKRGVINDILKKISFRLKLPGLEWQKVVGTSKIGASFGITVRNGMQLQLRTQSGFFKVDIDDEAFAEAHVGLLHINVDLFRAKLCFRGHIKYELNILKEYGINDVEDVIHIFDRVLDRLVNPIRQGISDFKNIVTMFKQKGPSGLIGDLVETVRSLPSIMKEILPKVTAFLQKILHINGLSWVEDIKHLVARVRAMVHDVQQDVMVFYHSVVDAVTVTLPHVGRKLWGAINKVVEAIKHVLRSPLKTFSTISSQITRIKEALKEGIQAKNQIAESAFFAKGTTPYWMVMKNDIVSIYNETKAIVKSIMEHFKNANSTAAAFFIPEDREKRLQEWYLMKNLTQELWDIIGPLNMIKDIASPFIRLFKDIVNAIKSTKTAYESIKHAIDVGMSQIKKIFGKKFHRDFPTEKRPETPQCGPGVFPTTSGGQFKTKGLDLLLQSGSKVVNPMSGTVTVRGDNEVLIQPSDSGFYGYEIIVANVAPTPEIIEASTEGGMEMASGQVLGHAIHSRCTPNSIHVAVRKRDRDSSNDYDDGDDDDVGYIYLDPLVYLERLLPRPHWVQECNDYKFTHIGQVFDSHSAAEKAKDIAHKYKRGMMKRMKKFQDQEFDPEPPYRPQNFRHDHEQSFVEDFKRNVKAAKLMINDFFTSGFKSGSKSHRTLGKILSLLQGSSNDTKSDVLLAIVSEFNKAKKKVDLMPAGAYTVPQLQNLLSQFGVDSKNGDRLSLMERVRKLPGLVCSGMRDIVSSGLGHVCVPDPDCYGLKCSIELNVKGFQASTEMGLRYDGCSGQFHITAGSETSIAKGFGAGGSLGLNLRVGVCFLSLSTESTITPWVGAKVWGSLAVDIGFARGGIKLIGYLMDVQFPVTAKITFSQFPVAVTSSMDVVLIPLRLQLQAYAELFLLFTTVTVYKGNLWSYQMQAIRKNIFTVTNKKATGSKPAITAPTSASRNKRSGASNGEGGCLVQQIAHRNPHNPAFQLEVFARNDFSPVKTFYAIGDHPGGNNVADWTEMSEYSVFIPVMLPGGIPLHWTVKVNNSEGLESLTSCTLETYDSTVPDGRFDPSYPFTSRKDTLKGTVIIMDDSPIVEKGHVAIGYGPGTLGSQVMSWKGLNLTKTHERPNDGTILKFFTVPQIGKLTKPSFKSIITKDSQECAQRCIKTGRKCLSFDYETATSICDMNDVIEGGGVERHRSGSYNHYERLGTTYMTFVDFNPSALHHGTPYYINVDIENKLGYTNTLPSAPIIPDFTPPEPGPVGNVSQDVTVPAGCRAAINQRCVDVIDTPNHRKIIDGPGASTVFNGHQAGIDQWYTLSTAHVSANWNGFQDKESGIWGYTWALGTSPCASDVVPFSEPLNNMGAVSRLQTTSFASELSLSDGPYFVTVQALNNVVLGGAMVTSVCHSWPLIVDTTPPEFNGVDSFRYDEDFDTLTIFYMAEDSLSLIAKVDFGLGRTKQDSTVRAYVTYPPLEGSWAGDSKEEATNGSVKRQKTKTMTMMMVVVENLDLTSGVTAWIRLRVNNNVGLYTSGHGDVPLLRDDTPPNPGTVSDGGDIEKEAGFQSDTSQLCANWAHFTDEETGIARYKWGAGSEAGLEDIVSFRELSHGTKQACAPVAGSVLQHNTTYYSTVIAFNNALNSQSVSATSNGVLVDLTPPTTSWAKDGSATGSSASPASPADVDFISDPSKVSCHWEAFDDPESGIDHYEVIMFVDGTLVKSTRVSNLSSPNFEDDTVSLKCGSKTSFKILGYDQAGLSNVTSTDGFLLDCTPPKLKSIRASEKGLRYQATNDRLDLTLDFEDTESGMLEYRVEVFEEYQSLKQHFWPALGNEVYHTVKLNGISDAPVSISVKNVTMKIGATYKAEVVALNRAGLSTRVNSDGVLIDMTEPILKNIHIGLDEEEEVSDDGSVIVDDPKHLAVSWVSRDPESGITRALVAIGTSPHEHEAGFGSVTHGFVEARSATRRSGGIFSIMFDDVSLNVTAETGAMYYVSVVTYNGAGLASKTAVSRPITVLEANVPGVLYDGVSMLSDTDFSKDTTTVSFSFAGFRSKACNIVSYEWGVGTQPFFSNMRPYSSHGLSMDNSTVGHGQAHLQLRSGQRYYVTVRALTGPRCRDKYILSTSNGLTIDASQPTLDIVDCTSGPLTCFVDSPYFVKDVDALNFVWRSQDQETEVEADFWFCGSLPATDDVRAKTSTNATYIAKSTFKDIQQSGRTIFISVGAVDSAGNEEVYTSNSITIDDTKPEVKDFVCSKAVSEFQTTIKCQWSAIEDAESLLGLTTMAVGTSSNGHDLLQPTPIFAEQKQWEFNLADHFDSGSLDPRRASTLYITLTATNVVSLSKVLSRSVTVDTTPPQVDSVNILTVATGVLTQEGANKTQDTDGVQCQDTDHYLEISMEGIHDNQSPIEKVVVVVSSSEQRDYLKMLTLTEVTPTVIISDLHVPDGTTLSASVTVSNSAGLFTQITRSVVVSVDPQLTVQDGGSLYRNLDFQSDLSTLQAHWTMTGHCAVVLTEWSVIDTDGKVVRDFKPVTSEGLVSGDEFSLENGHTYINIIRVTDTLNRTLTSRSDGVTVMIQPPDPGQVRDGLVGEDSDYQLSSTELSANWDTFGNRSLEPSPNQRITRYEVAVGTSVGDSKGRHNVHHFVHAGLNTSYTFTGLNLTTKEVTYYITVRGYSEAGSFTESSSDGIRVGYSSRITRGQVEHAAVQASTDQIDVSWKGFLSDIGMKRYVVGVSDGVPGTHHHHHNLYNYHSSSNKNSSSNSNNSSNSIECSEIYANRNMFNVRLPVNVGLDTFVALTGLTLRHSGRYYVTVVAEDITGHCALVTGSPITVDTTPPEKVTPRAAVPAAAVVEPEKGSAPASVSGANTVIVNGVNGPTSVVYATNTDRLQVTWSGSFRDAESGISKYQVELLAMADIMSECRVGVGGSGGTGEEGGASGPSSVERQEWEKENAAAEHHGNRWTSNKEDHVKDVIIEEMTLSANVTEANFYHLDLTHTAFYYIRVTASNGAGLDSSISSVPIKVDTTPPVVGAVKSGDDWATDQTFAASTSLMSGMFALAADQRSYDCPQDRSVVGSDGKLVDLWRPLDGDRDRNQDYSASAVSVDRDGIRLTIRYDDSLVRLLKGGILSDLSALQVGNYTSVLQALAGQKMVTSMALTPDMAIGPQSFEPPQDDQFSLYEEEHWDQTSNLGQKYSQQKNNDSSSSSSSSSSSGSNNNKSSSSNVKASQNSRQLTTEATTTVVTTKQQGTVSSAPNVTQQRDPRIFGMGYDILGYKVPESVPSSAATTWYCLFWVTDKNGDKREWVDLDFDPTASENEYIIAVTQEEDDRVTRGRTFGAKFYVNGQEKAAYSGLSFESPVHTYAYVRNIDGYKPTVTGPFDSFSADAVLADFRVPVQTKKLCKYGSAFFDGDSGIHEIWLGLSDERTAEVSPVMPYKLHSRFCKPCMSSCSIGCDRKCSAAEFQGKGFDVVHFNLTGLNLIRSEFNATTNDSLQNPGSPGQLKSSSMSYYYLQVKAVNFAGQETVGLSKGTMVDLTPPLFQAVTCVDPSYSMDEPSDYQGTTESVGAYWECEEDVGEIIDYTLGVGTRPGKADVFMEGGKDLRIKGQRDLRTKRALAGLDRLLRTNQTYYVVVIATNNAGLQSNMSCNITVDTEPPSVVGVVPKTAGAYRSFSTGEPASLLEDSSRIEINWAGGPKEVAFYEWQIGTTTGQSDIFPRIKIGTGQSNKVSLVNGQLYMDGASANQSMSISMMARRNWTNQDSVQQSKAQSSTFHMEPGRCLHYGLYAVSKSHMAAPIQVPATCITRKTDVIDDFDFSQIRSLNLNAGKKSANNDSHEVKMVMEGVDGRVMAGLLSSNDLQTGFGSAASTSFKPFIQDPLASRGHTTRFLRNRIQDFLDTSFYLSPAPVARLTKPLRVDLTFDPHKYFGDNRPMLVFWDTDSQKWGSVDENCDGGKHIDMEAGTFTAKICPYHSLPEDRNMNPKRSRRSAGPSFQSTQYALVSASPYANTPPVIVTNEIVAREDHSLTVDIQCQDKENDAVFLMITKPPTKGQALIVNDTFLSYKPYKDAYGTDSLVLKVKEQNTKLFSSLESSKTITVRIKGDNDSPVVLYVQTNGQEMRVNSKQNITVPLEGNSRNYYLGNIILTDVDYNETFYWKILPTDLLPSFFQLTKEPVSPRNSLLEEVRQAKTTANYSVSLTLPRNMTGRFGFRFVASDHKTMTTSITQILALDLWVFTNPCVHGRCDVNPNFKVPCNSKSRISSFDQFQCKCDEGYKGERCTQAQQSASKVSAAEIVAYCLAATLGVVLLAIVLYFCLRSKFVHNKVSAVRRFSESLERQTGQIVECLTVSQPKPQMITSGHPKVVNVSSNTTTADSVAKGTNDQRLVGRLVTLLDGGSLLTIGGGEEEVEEETVVMSREDEREENRVGRGREGGGSGGGVITVNEGHGQMSDSGQPGQNLSLLQRSDTELTKVSM
ncbi:uncharacterized protein LOC115224694 [Argonauta hians]